MLTKLQLVSKRENWTIFMFKGMIEILGNKIHNTEEFKISGSDEEGVIISYIQYSLRTAINALKLAVSQIKYLQGLRKRKKK